MKEFIRQQFKVFLISHMLITIAVGSLGLILSPDTRFGYEALFVPLLYAVLCILPGFVMYSNKELSVKQIIIRKILQLALIEGIIMFLLYLFGSLNSPKIVLTVMVSVVIVYISVQLIGWISEIKDTNIMNSRLEQIKKEN